MRNYAKEKTTAFEIRINKFRGVPLGAARGHATLRKFSSRRFLC